MALTQLEKVRAMRYLGWPAKTVISGTTHYNNIINNRFDGLDSSSETVFREVMSRLECIDERLAKARARLAAAKVGDIELNENEVRELRSERIREIRELSDLVDIAVIKQGTSTAVVV